MANPWAESEGAATGKAAPLKEQNYIFTPDEIGKMSRDEFNQNESDIMQQVKNGFIKSYFK